MGRKSLNKTYEQILRENRERSKQYYELHKERLNRQSMDRYNRLKKEHYDRNLQDNK